MVVTLVLLTHSCFSCILYLKKKKKKLPPPVSRLHRLVWWLLWNLPPASFPLTCPSSSGSTGWAISWGRSADMYPESRTKAQVRASHGLEGFADENRKGGGVQGSKVREHRERQTKRTKEMSGAVSNGARLSPCCACLIYAKPLAFIWMSITHSHNGRLHLPSFQTRAV